jgi:hypothetical protein
VASVQQPNLDELAEGAVEHGLAAELVAGEGGEGGSGFAEQSGPAVSGTGEVGVTVVALPFVVGHLELGGLRGLEALGAPEGQDHPLAEALFQGVVGLEELQEGIAEGLELRGVLEGEFGAGDRVLVVRHKYRPYLQNKGEDGGEKGGGGGKWLRSGRKK